MKIETIGYAHGGVDCRGRLAYDEKKPGKRPAVLVAHAWAGRDEFATAKAEALARLGYAGFALDNYGGAKIGKDKDENMKLMRPFIEDRKLLLGRLTAGFEAARALPQVDAERIGIIGFCFGGLCALDLARGGAALRGAVSFHGLLGAPEGLPKKKISAKLLVLHGYADPMADPGQLAAFCREMDEAKADWQVHAYGGVLHAFTNPAAADPGFGTVYDKKADERSWSAMRNFFEEVFR